jgi:hypothetical protein
MVSTNAIIGKWTVLSLSSTDGKNRYWLCRCKCGKEADVRQDNLNARLSTMCRSCGNHARAMPVVSRDGTVRYPTFTAAAKALGLDKRTLHLAIDLEAREQGHVWQFEEVG